MRLFVRSASCADNSDRCAAWLAAFHHEPSRSRNALGESEDGISVHFRQKWLRDPDSAYLTRYAVGCTWDEPELFVMLWLRQEAWRRAQRKPGVSSD